MTSFSASPFRETPLLLIVEDSNEDFEALQRFLRRSSIAIPIQRCVNGEQALAFLYRTGNYIDRQTAPRPGLIMLDLNLPGTDGREVLRRIKQDDSLNMIPVVVFTTSNNPKDIEVCYRYGVNSYIVKPINFAQLKRDIQMLVEYWFEVTTLPDCPKD
ncbi:MAG: response regulator [Nostoc sp.]|uniref:response regulator n=1 Tax=Nostoc sp. TaxID=1180 RepID=UPI002FF6BD2E